MDRDSTERILARYPHATAFQRWHMRGRLHLCPYPALLKHITGAGSVLDIGCGFGHLAWFLAERRPDLAYRGSDIDGRKIRLAQGCTAPDMGRPPEFREGDATSFADWPEHFGNILFLDVIYLMPWALQVRILEWAMGRLSPGGESSLIIKSMDAPEGLPGWRAVAEEWIMVSLLKRTLSSGTLRGARSSGDYADFARGLGFRSEVETLPTFNPSYILTIRR